MKKRVAIRLIVALCLSITFVSVSASGIDDEFKALTHYAQEYEIGNINYPQFLISP